MSSSWHHGRTASGPRTASDGPTITVQDRLDTPLQCGITVHKPSVQPIRGLSVRVHFIPNGVVPVTNPYPQPPNLGGPVTTSVNNQ